ncbi:MAG: ABC transporter substrate-binding protein [Chloroflexi bacterium]|nr:ABC transporter substrate-binding protein [Chloroflexota bacterium]
MDPLDSSLSRRRFLKATAGVGGLVAFGGIAAACSAPAASTPAGSSAVLPSAGGPSASVVASAVAAATGTFNWMTWSDHYYEEQLADISSGAQIKTSVSELADNSEGFTKVKEVGGQLDMISGDALWVPKYFEDGLIEAWDINELAVSKQLYSIAREFQIWTKPEGYLGYPFGWSPVQLYYNPKFVTTAPDSWEVLLDPKYKGHIVVENQPVEIVAYMAKLGGAVDPYNMTDAELATAKDLMTRLKPNLLKLTQQNTETISALVSEEAWIATGNLGAEERVKEAKGPEIKGFTPKEGTVGWMDAEMLVKGGKNNALLKPFLEVAEQANYIAENFIKYGRPLFNEEAYKLLVDKGHKDRADRFLYNKPETVLEMTLKGPGSSTQGAIAAFNEVFGA